MCAPLLSFSSLHLHFNTSSAMSHTAYRCLLPVWAVEKRSVRRIRSAVPHPVFHGLAK
jgi:hypothetical protein